MYRKPPTRRRAFLTSAGLAGGAALLAGHEAARAQSANRRLPSGAVVSVKDHGALGDGRADDTRAIQAAVNAALGNALFFPPGKYKITSPIRILGALTITGVRAKSTLMLATPNMDGLVFGDGTDATRALTPSSSISGLSFNPFEGVATFTSGACMFLNKVYDVKVSNCIFYGKDRTAERLFDGVRIFQGTNTDVSYCQFYSMGGSALVAHGAPGLENRSVDCRFDQLQIYSGVDGITLGDYCAGINVIEPIMSGFKGWGLKIDTGYYNFFVGLPNIESAGKGAIYVKRGSAVAVTGGWTGGTGPGLHIDAAASDVHSAGVQYQSLEGVVVGGPACSLADCDIVGTTTTPTGVTVNAGGADLTIEGGRIRQWKSEAIKFVGNPPRCLVLGVNFKNNGANITGISYADAPRIRSCVVDSPPHIQAAETLPLRQGHEYVQATGATPIRVIPVTGFASRLTLQAGKGGITLHHGADINLKGGVNAVIPEFATLDLICVGISWQETGRSF